MAAQLGALHRVLFQETLRRTLNKEPNDQIAAALTKTGRTAFTLLEPALGTYAVLSAPPSAVGR